jgi:hypothetical protein
MSPVQPHRRELRLDVYRINALCYRILTLNMGMTSDPPVFFTGLVERVYPPCLLIGLLIVTRRTKTSWALRKIPRQAIIVAFRAVRGDKLWAVKTFNYSRSRSDVKLSILTSEIFFGIWMRKWSGVFRFLPFHDLDDAN